MKYRFYLDGIEVDEPQGFSDFEEEIIRDEQNRVIYTDLPIELTFFGNGYEYIEGVYQEAYNREIDLAIYRVEGSVMQLYLKAFIKLSNCEFHLSLTPKQHVIAEIDDSVYQARIFNNIKRPVGIGGNESLNSEFITPLTPIDLTVFIVSNGDNVATTRKAFDVKDALSYCVSFISDNRISFESTWYDNLDDDQKLSLVTGVELRDPGSDSRAPVVVLEELLDNLFRLHNLYLICENNLSNPVVRLETEDYLHGSESSAQFDSLEGVSRSMDYEKLYNVISLGDNSAIVEYGTNFSYFYIPFIAFAPEKYNVSGVINADRELDLTTTRNFIIDNNAIANAIQNDVDDNDERTFIIQYDSSTDVASKNPNFPSIDLDNRFYNESLQNNNVINRYGLLGEIVLNSGLLDASFEASQTTPLDVSPPLNLISNTGSTILVDIDAVPFDDDSTPPNFDTDDNYDNSTYVYTAPVSGAYRFRFGMVFNVAGFVDPTGILRVRPTMAFRLNDSENIQPNQYQVFNYSDGEVGSFINWELMVQSFPNEGIDGASSYYLVAEQTLLLDAGDEVTAAIRLSASVTNQTNAFSLLQCNIQDSVFSNPTTPISGGIYENKDPDDYYVGLYKAKDIYISPDKWDKIKNGLNEQIIFDTGNNDPRKAYIRNIKRNTVTGKADIELLFNRKQVNY